MNRSPNATLSRKMASFMLIVAHLSRLFYVKKVKKSVTIGFDLHRLCNRPCTAGGKRDILSNGIGSREGRRGVCSLGR